MTFDAEIETDSFDFLLQGVLTLLPDQAPANYLPNYHASSDTFDKVDLANLKKQSAIAAITAYALCWRSLMDWCPAVAFAGRAALGEHGPRPADEVRGFLVGMAERNPRSSVAVNQKTTEMQLWA
jgi:hypothetical protein